MHHRIQCNIFYVQDDAIVEEGVDDPYTVPEAAATVAEQPSTSVLPMEANEATAVDGRLAPIESVAAPPARVQKASLPDILCPIKILLVSHHSLGLQPSMTLPCICQRRAFPCSSGDVLSRSIRQHCISAIVRSGAGHA